MTRKRKINFLAIMFLVFAVVFTSVILAFDNLNTSNAYNGGVPASIGSLTLSDYATRSDGLVFSNTVLQKLYGAILGKTNATYNEVLSAVNKSDSILTGGRGVVNTQNKSMNFAQINSGSAITVDFGGFKWNVVYATTNTNANSSNGAKAGDLIVTLWMSENDTSVTYVDTSTNTVKSASEVLWSGFATSSANTSNAYPQHMYSTSKLRVDTLNGGGDAGTTYAVSNTSRTGTQLSRTTHHYAQFTMSEKTAVGNKSLTRFLANPVQVNYQKSESWIWALSSAGTSNLVNEAWENTGGYSNTGTSNNNNLTVQKPSYYDWAKQDFLWEPSMTELGFKYTGEPNTGTATQVSLWGIPNDDPIIVSSTGSWMRSGGYNSIDALVITPLGTEYWYTSPTVYGVRPALHLNLTQAQANVTVSASDFSVDYDGTAKGIEDADWYTTAIGQSFGTVKYYSSANTSGTTTKPTAVGDYQVGLTPNTGRVWADGSTGEKKIKFSINKALLLYPSFTVDKQAYNGGGFLNFQIENYNSSQMTISVPSEYGSDVAINGSMVRAKNVGVYTLNVSLKDSDNYGWQSNGTLQFEVERAPIYLKISDVGGANTISGPASGTVDVLVDVDTTKGTNVFSGQSVLIDIMAKLIGHNVDPIKVGQVTIVNGSTQQRVTLDLDWLTAGDNYEFSFVPVEKGDNNKDLDGKNYKVENQTTATLNVLDASFTTKITWRLSVDGVPEGNQRFDTELTDGPTAFDGRDIFYDGKLYGFQVTPPTDYSLESIETEPVGITLTSANIGRYAAQYKTTVRLRKGSTTSSHVVTWEIKKAKIDLSAVKWQGDGKMEYTGSDIKIDIDSATLPEGLIADVTCAASRNVGPCAPASVTFRLENGYEINYELPVQSNSNSYVYTPTGDMPSTFPWSINWEIVKAKIQLKWVQTTLQDKNGKDFTAYVLEDDKGVIVYHFYETDNLGTIKNPSAFLTLEEMEIVENQRLYFKAKPEFTNSTVANNYEIVSDPTNEYSPVFEFGDYAEALEVDISNKTFVYNAKAFAPNIQFVSGIIDKSQFDFVFYDRGATSALTSAPVNVGLYTVAISLKSGVSGYYLTGDNVEDGTAYIDFEITKRIIDNSTWVTSHNPPSLKLTFADMGGIMYEYALADDETNTVLAFNYIATHPGNYKVRARIKDANNYEFANDFEGDFFNTDWVEFTVSENEQLYDPLDPSNPFYPEDPDNPIDPDKPGPTDPEKPGDGDGDGGSVLDKIKEFFDNLIESNFPLWQVCTMAVGGLLSLIFLIKSIQYGKRRKNAKNETKKINAKMYATIAPIFATDVIYAGLTNQIWSIIAFSVVGLTVFLFLVMLLTRHGWKKAEKAKELALENLEQRKYEAQDRKDIALQERLAQIGQGGTISGDSASIEEILRRRDEEHRREMEELREEQAKRDEAMKIMLANMMGRQQGTDDMPIYGSIDDTDLLVQKVIAGLLPAVQQMMPEATAYLSAPSEENEELKALVEEQKALVEEQSEEIRNMSEQIASLQEQLVAMNEDRVDGVLLPDQSEEMKELTDQIAGLQEQLIAMTQDRVEGVLLPDESEEMKALTEQIAELQNQLIEMSQQRVVVPNNQSEEIKTLTDKIEELQAQIADSKADTPDNGEEIKALTAQIAELQEQLSNSKPETVVTADNSEEIKALTAEVQKQFAKIDDLQNQLANMSQGGTTTVYVEKDSEDDDVDDEEEWDSILDEDDDDFLEAVIIEEDGTVKKTSPNFRMRLKQSSDKNREWYTAIKNLFCSQKGVTYRVYKRVEKIRYQGQVIAVIGIAKRSIKLWLALKPYEYDARRYHHKDVSDKPRFVDVPMYVRVGSDRALTRAQELILALFQEQNMEVRKRYNDRTIQELIFTLKHNKLLTNKQNKQLLCEVMHVHDCDVLDDETAEKCIETKNVEFIDDSVIETVKLDDIDANFQDGNRVTLDKLKKVGLVSEECTGYNVVADKRLTKPLIIVANDFNLTAVKLIALTGGRVIKLTQV